MLAVGTDVCPEQHLCQAQSQQPIFYFSHLEIKLLSPKYISLALQTQNPENEKNS